MSFLNLEVLKGKPIKFLGILPHLKLSKNFFWNKKFERKKICNSYGLMKI
jgi:hypothetical protein